MMRSTVCGVVGLVLLWIVSPGVAEDGLLLHYTFDEGSGRIVHDRSGHGRDGTIEGGAAWVKGKPFGALSFNGKDAVVAGPADVPIDGTGTLEVWCHPRAFGGGLVSWHYDHADAPKPLSLYFDIYSYNSLIGVVSDWKAPPEEVAGDAVLHWNPAWRSAKKLVVEGADLPAELTRRWSHIVMTFDDTQVRIFRNGELQASRPSFIAPQPTGIAIRIGQGYPQGLPWFDGMIAEVRVYDRALSEGEVASHFAEKAAMFQPHLPRRLTIVPRLHVKEKSLIIDADLTHLALGNGVVEAQLVLDGRVLHEAAQPITDGKAAGPLVFPTSGLTVDEYEVRCAVRDEAGELLVETTRRWRMPKLYASGARVLNNLVAELLVAEDVAVQPEQQLTFTNPREGWVFITCEADLRGADTVRIAVDGGPAGAAITLAAGAAHSGETMYFLPQGECRLTVRTEGEPTIRRITVRSIPELMVCGFPGVPKVAEFGDFDYEFLKDDVLPNINTIVGSWNQDTFDNFAARQSAAWPPERLAAHNMLARWHEMGRRWLQEQPIPSVLPKFHSKTNPVTPEVAFGWWAESFGFTDPQWSGVVADEFGLGADGPTDTWPHRDPRYRTAPYIPAIRQLASSSRFKGRCLYIWCGGLDRAEKRDQHFVEAVRSAGYKLAMEEYLSEPPTEQAARDLLYHHLRTKLDRADANFPGLVEDLILVPGIYSAPPLSHSVDATVDYKVWMDMQMHYISNAPECFGLSGIMWYKITYADEEAVRWMGRLLRHYAIEGNTQMLSPLYGYTYRLEHVRNPDFEEGLAYWDIHEAEPGAVRPDVVNSLGLVIGRMRQNHMGIHVMRTRRSAAGPNTASQIIRNLTSGQLYSAKMVVCDYQTISRGGTEKGTLPSRLSIDDADLIIDKCFVSRPKGVPADFHRIVFRAKGPTAKLTISDWATDDAPGGPVGQELMFNYIEVQPYFE